MSHICFYTVTYKRGRRHSNDMHNRHICDIYVCYIYVTYMYIYVTYMSGTYIAIYVKDMYKQHHTSLIASYFTNKLSLTAVIPSVNINKLSMTAVIPSVNILTCVHINGSYCVYYKDCHAHRAMPQIIPFMQCSNTNMCTTHVTNSNREHSENTEKVF